MSFRRLGLLLALPTVVGLFLAACGTEDDAAPPPSSGGSGPTGGTGGTDEEGGGTGGNAASGGTSAEGGMGGSDGPGGAGGDSAGGAGGDSSGGDGPGSAGNGAGGEGGAPGPVGCHTVLQAFDTDPAGAMGKYLTPDTGPVQSSTVEWSSTEGVTAKGAGKLNATFGAAGEQAQLSLYFTHASWTCTTKMHAKVKLVAADLSHIKGLTLNINSGNWTRYASKFTNPAGWTSDTWYSIELPFAMADYLDPANTLPDFTDVQAIGVMIQTKSDVTPVPTTLYVDDVWVE